MRVAFDQDQSKEYRYLAEIVRLNGNFTYGIKWITQGPFETDVINSIPQRSFAYRFIRPYHGVIETSELLGNTFNTPTKGIKKRIYLY